jgi:hypothetical protein
MGIFEVAIEFINTWTASQYGSVVTLFLITIPIIIYAVFIFYLYRFVARKNILELNLSQYNSYSAGPLLKIIPIFLYIIEYIIILPIVSFFWFAVFSVLIFFLAAELPLQTVLLISAALIASVRVTSYISENLSQDLAKMLPLTLLGIALTNPVFFNFTEHISKISTVPTLFNEVISFLAFIVIIELIMRILDLFVNVSYISRAMKDGTPTEDE